MTSRLRDGLAAETPSGVNLKADSHGPESAVFFSRLYVRGGDTIDDRSPPPRLDHHGENRSVEPARRRELRSSGRTSSAGF